MVTPNKIAFEKPYRDNSGIEFAVRYDHNNYDPKIEFERVEKIDFPISEIDWLINCLKQIKEIHKKETTKEEV